MGRQPYSTKLEADYHRKITIYELNKPGLLRGYKAYKETDVWWKDDGAEQESSFGLAVCTMVDCEFVLFDYVLTLPDGTTQDISHRFPLTTTSCNFGGTRYWFICSHEKDGKQCGRRVGVLYMKDGIFACRHCHNLTYESRKLSGRYKTAGRIISIPEVQKAEKAVKRMYYAGKMTRKYARFLWLFAKAKRTYAMHIGITQEMVEQRNARNRERAGIVP